MATTASAAPAATSAIASAIASALNAATSSNATNSKGSAASSRPRIPPLRTKYLSGFPSELRSPLIYGGSNTPRSSGVYSAGPNSAFFSSRGFESTFMSSTASTPSSASLKRPRGIDEDSPDDTDPGVDPMKTPITPPTAYVDFLRAITPSASPSYTPIATHFPTNSQTTLVKPAVQQKTVEFQQATVEDDSEDDNGSVNVNVNNCTRQSVDESNNDGDGDDDDDSLSDSDYLSDFSDAGSSDSGATPCPEKKPVTADIDVSMQEHDNEPRIQSQTIEVPAESSGPLPSPSIRADMSDSQQESTPKGSGRTMKGRKMEIHVPPSSHFIWAFPQSGVRPSQTNSPRVPAHNRSQSTPIVPSPLPSATSRREGMTPLISPGMASASSSNLRNNAAVASAAAAATAAAAGLSPPPGMSSARFQHSVLSPLPSASLSRSPMVSPLVSSGPYGPSSRQGGPPCNTPATASAHALTSNRSLPTSPTGTQGPTRTVCQVIQRTITYSSRHGTMASPTTPSHPSSSITEVTQANDNQNQDESERNGFSKRRKMKLQEGQ